MSSITPAPRFTPQTTSTDGDEETPTIISGITVLSLSIVLSMLITAYAISRVFLPKASTKLRLLFIWHAFDATVHFILEGSYLYNCFTQWKPLPSITDLADTTLFPIPFTPYGTSFLGQSARLYGSFYGDNLFAKIWQEYARADRRWGGADLTVISLELLTVFIMAPLSVYVCVLLARGQESKAWFVMTVVATGELYGGFMTFCPEWLVGSPNLDSSNFLFLWVYLIFFNAGLWVTIPFWVLSEAYFAFSRAFDAVEVKKNA